MLKYRILTALILLPLLVAAILKLPMSYFTLLLAFITALGAWEWSGLVGFKAPLLRGIFVVAIILGLALSFFVNPIALIVVGLLYWLWVCFAVMRFNAGKSPLGLELPSLRIFSGVIFLVCGFVAVIAVRTFLPNGPAWLLVMFFVIAAADTGAYFSGRAFGKKQMAKLVSPNKTWAGFWGGFLLALLVSIIGTFFLNLNWSSRIAFWCLSLIAAFFSVIGDLSISVMKRQVNAKDSGGLLPGHGGFLDRLDSVYAGMVIFALGSLWL